MEILTKIEIFRKFYCNFSKFSNKTNIFKNLVQYRHLSKIWPNGNFSKFWPKSNFFEIWGKMKSFRKFRPKISILVKIFQNFRKIWILNKFCETIRFLSNFQKKYDFGQILEKFRPKTKFFENFRKIEIFRMLTEIEFFFAIWEKFEIHR